jgi:hypothetical protein
MNNKSDNIKLGIGFITGRKNFKNLIKTYINNWNECGLIGNNNISLNLFIAYDLNYYATTEGDYKDLDQEILDMVDSVNYIDETAISNEKRKLIKNGVINQKEAELVFGEGYGRKRNAVVHFALKFNINYLLFIDDDEYPVVPMETEVSDLIWKGQSVVATHLKYIANADITHGYHCGYISPIPNLKFNTILQEEDFKIFIEAVSNDIISWDSLRKKMKTGGITFADKQMLKSAQASEVKEIQGAKFISGSNLCLNLDHIDKIAPFYNPPGARGEDTFLSTCLTDVKVLKVPCYTFHDGFLNYPHLLHGVLPRLLKPAQSYSQQIQQRFLKASLGWIRYKPLFLYITQPKQYDIEIEKIYQKLLKSIPKICRYFQTKEFIQIYTEFERYHKLTRKHFDEFETTKFAWKKVVNFVQSTKCEILNDSLVER